MTITAQTPRVKVAGNGSTTAFAFNFLIPSASDGSALCNVYVFDTTVTPNTLTLLSSSTYSVSGLNVAAGGSVTYPLTGSPLATGKYLIIMRAAPYTQPTVVANQGFYPHTVETSEDWIVEQTQQLQYLVGLCLQVPPSDSAPGTIPSVTDRASKLAGYDSSGNPNVTSFSEATFLANVANTAANAAASATSAANAATSATGSANSATASANSATLAQDWAVNTTAKVSGIDYSSKEYAIGVLMRGLLGGGSAKDWAEYMGGTVDDTGYSAKWWVQQAVATTLSRPRKTLTVADSPYSASPGQLLMVDASGGNVTIVINPAIWTSPTLATPVTVMKTDISGNTVIINDGTSNVTAITQAPAVANLNCPTMNVASNGATSLVTFGG